MEKNNKVRSYLEGPDPVDRLLAAGEAGTGAHEEHRHDQEPRVDSPRALATHVGPGSFRKKKNEKEKKKKEEEKEKNKEEKMCSQRRSRTNRQSRGGSRSSSP
ncbi:hypothetical protein EYF80_052761 [Liparis tanakae]|uniref:Uncharacterized protein n=1 Tax=Liparis tanakae TaxID=230148 RepID=A0A4Z2F7T5_9TELE|nr:hypothetical protein EYF80_052761 [Liparis tanakae]